MVHPWYERVSADARLDQGDIVADCPVLAWRAGAPQGDDALRSAEDLRGLAQRGEPRLRLRPPYREHLSQAFARFFMRVGLPTDIKRTW